MYYYLILDRFENTHSHKIYKSTVARYRCNVDCFSFCSVFAILCFLTFDRDEPEPTIFWLLRDYLRHGQRVFT